MPIDFYSGYANKSEGAADFGKINYNPNEDKICIEGPIFVYRSEKDGIFCFNFDGNTFQDTSPLIWTLIDIRHATYNLEYVAFADINILARVTGIEDVR